MNTLYFGWRDQDARCHVRVREGRGKPMALARRADLVNHSPDGFEWGYAGSGPAQLALALIAHATDDDALAQRIHQDFKRYFIATMSREAGHRWAWTHAEIIERVADCQKRRADRAQQIQEIEQAFERKATP